VQFTDTSASPHFYLATFDNEIYFPHCCASVEISTVHQRLRASHFTYRKIKTFVQRSIFLSLILIYARLEEVIPSSLPRPLPTTACCVLGCLVPNVSSRSPDSGAVYIDLSNVCRVLRTRKVDWTPRSIVCHRRTTLAKWFPNLP
jgi:hypothetical protein